MLYGSTQAVKSITEIKESLTEIKARMQIGSFGPCLLFAKNFFGLAK
jgi:hypothetical protein